MEYLSIENDHEIEVEFIKDHEVVHIIKDVALQKNHSKIVNEALNSSCKSRVLTKNNKTKQLLDSSTDEHSYENELDIILKPKALFEDGDVPGERMFGFQNKQNQKSTNLKTQIYNSKIRKYNNVRNNSKNYVDNDTNNEEMFLSDNDSEIKLKTSRISTRATLKTVPLQSEDILVNNDIQTNNKFCNETSRKSKRIHNVINLNVQNSTKHINLTSKTPRSEKYKNSDQILTKTPKVIRKQIAKGIAYQKCEQLNEVNDSDYSISDKSDLSDSSDSSINSNKNKTIQLEVDKPNILLRRSSRKKEVPFMYKSEEYFLSKSAKSLKKSKTSDNTLKLLRNPILDKIQVDQLSESSNNVHSKKIKTLYKEIETNFPYWLCLLKEGFNLLLYGFGSKRQIINDFRTSMLENESVLVINGFFPGLTLKEILESINIDLLALESCPGSVELAIQQIEEMQKLKHAEPIYILIHNLDGVELQNYKTQHVLSRICSLKKVHLVASIDKVNAALMWDNTKLGNYNFIWMDCTNYLPYKVETSYIESLMVKNTGSIHAFSALINVFKSLNSNSKSILLLLIKDRIDNKNDKKYSGVPFSILYGWCRQRFLVSTDLALRSQLTEFVDHHLVKWKRDADVLYVPVDVDVLIQFYKQNEQEDDE